MRIQKQKDNEATLADLPRRYLRNPEVLFRTYGEYIQLIHLHNPKGDLFRIDGLAQSIWLGFDGKKTVKEISVELLTDLNVEKTLQSKFCSDVAVFVEELLEHDFLIENRPISQNEDVTGIDWFR